MNIPIDEMLTELRSVLEAFDANPSFSNFDNIQEEIIRIERACEDAILAAPKQEEV